MSKLFERGWPLKIFSVVMAIVIWLLITANENPEKNLEFQNIPVSVSEDQLANGLSVINEAELVTDVVIRGRSNDLLTYNAKNIQASVDLSTITKPGEYELPVSAALADNKNNTFAVVKTSPAKIKVIVDYVSEKEVPVEVTSTGEVAKNYLLGDLVPASQHILVSGPESELDTVAAAKVEINVAKLEKTTTLTGEVILVDGEGKPIDNPYITTRDKRMDVEIKVLVAKTLPLRVQLDQFPEGISAEDFEVTLSPAEITVAGEPEMLDGMDAVYVGKLDVSKIEASVVMTAGVEMPDGVRNVSNIQSVDMTVKYKEYEKRTITISNLDNYELLNFPADADRSKVEIVPVEITLKGVKRMLDQLDPNEIKVAIDFEGQLRAAGAYTVPGDFTIPQLSTVKLDGEFTVDVNISE